MQNPSTAWDILFGRIIEVCNRLYPLQKIKLKMQPYAYITDDVLGILHNRDLAFQRAKRTDNQDDWVRARQSKGNWKPTTADSISLPQKNIVESFLQEKLMNI